MNLNWHWSTWLMVAVAGALGIAKYGQLGVALWWRWARQRRLRRMPYAQLKALSKDGLALFRSGFTVFDVMDEMERRK